MLSRVLTRTAVFNRAMATRACSAVPGGVPIEGTWEYILPTKHDNVALITLNRPKALNALCDGLIAEINKVTADLEKQEDIGAIVVTGSERAFAAGADIKEMADRQFAEVWGKNMFADWASIGNVRKPVIAAVNGFSLGGGCELAMLADMIIAGENAQFGQPEVLIGTIPGCGGTQRLIRAVGKSKAMYMVLTGDRISAAEAEKAGLVAKVVPTEKTVEEAMRVAKKIAGLSQPVIGMAKEAVNAAYEMTQASGLEYERRLFHASFALDDRREGMAAFKGKREPEWKHK